MNRWRVGEDRGSKKTDGFPLTPRPSLFPLFSSFLIILIVSVTAVSVYHYCCHQK
jgi:hypothetical protein